MTIAEQTMRAVGVPENKILALNDITKAFDDFYTLLRSHLECNFDSAKALHMIEEAFANAKSILVLQKDEGGES